MATHHMNQVKVDRENMNVFAKKAIKPVATLGTRRAALGEVGNKLHLQQQKQPTKPVVNIPQKKEECKKSVVTKPPSPIVKKPSILIRRDGENKQKVKREESIVSKLHSSSRARLEKFNIDDDCTDPNLVSAFSMDIFKYLRELENIYSIPCDYLKNHKSTPRMRKILVNWLVEVHSNFKLLQETLHIAIAILDQYLPKHTEVGRDSLQLVGITSLVVACKYEEVYFPDLMDFKFVCDDAFSRKEILEMEMSIIKSLNFNLGRPISLQFLKRYSRVGEITPKTYCLAKYLLEIALLEYELCHVAPSLQAAAAFCLANSIINGFSDAKLAWTSALIHYASYNYNDFAYIMPELLSAVSKIKNSKQKTVYEKYASVTYFKISNDPKLNGDLVSKLNLGSVSKNN